MVGGPPDAEVGPEPIMAVTSCNAGYLPFVAALARSLSVAHPSPSAIELTILHDGIDVDSRHRVAAGAYDVDLHWVHVDDAAYEEAGLSPEPLIRSPQYFRCLLATLLPAAQQRCIYLDADTIVRRDLRELWLTDLDGAAAGAALDYFLPRTGDAVAPWRALGLDPEARYFNSGVMVVDLEAWRTRKVGVQAAEICLANREYLRAQGVWPQHDQFGLNVVLHRQWKLLPQEWNYLSEMEFAEPNIVHYCGGGKPGSPTCQPDFSSWFHNMVDGTAWRGFRVTQ